jgi:2-dehydro-3-deoxygalactonokinase
MVGAKQGWVEVPYINSPCDIRNLNFKTLNILDDINIHILSGVSQSNPSDVMRGEETQIAGFLLNNIDFNGSICLPGTHSKWVDLNSYDIKKFTSFLTGELYEIVKKYSILKHSLNTTRLEDEIVKSAANLIIENPSFISNKLFEIRAENLLKNSNQTSNNSKLVGYLLGIELSGSKTYWEDKDLVIIGSSNLNKYYELILNGRSKSIQLFNSNDMVLNGLSFFKKSLNL